VQPFNGKVALVLTSLMLAACASAGNQSIAEATNESVASQLTKGRTTQADVRRAFGDPIKTSFTSNGNESWEYEFSRMQSKVTNFIPYVNLVHSGAEGDKKSLVIFFDRAKVVQDYTMSTSQINVSTGLITD
jgi:curli biogenesis system outer membrane secretion channel CsgG